MNRSDPADSLRQARLDEVLADYMIRLDRGEPVDREQVLADHPDFADELRAYFETDDQMAQLASPRRETRRDRRGNAACTPVPGASTQEPSDPELLIGDYELLNEIARGGMGIVYQARQLSLNRIVALKMIRAGQLASTEEVLRFRHEAEAVARLDHPNIVPVYEVGQTRGEHFFSMKMIEGGNLKKWIADQHRASAGHKSSFHRTAAQLLAQVARAVHYAHQRGILHRDLKPANILLAREAPACSRAEGSSGYTPYVTDFGLAKQLGGGALLTASEMMVGTPEYMAPEQVSGGRGGLTTAADVYGMGAILYEVLTGTPPFEAETPLATARKVVDEEPRPPSSLYSRVNRDLSVICLKCLHKEPQRRYRSAEALAEDLERWLRGEPIAARSVGRLERLGRWCRRNKVTAALLSALAIVMTGALIVFVSLWLHSEDQRRQAVANLDEAARQRKRAEQFLGQARQVVDEFCIQLSQEDLRDLPGVQPVRKKLLEAGLRYYQGFLQDQGNNAELETEVARAYYRVGLITSTIGPAPDALAAYQQAERMYAALSVREPAELEWQKQLAACKNELALLRKQRGELTAASAAWQEALALRQKVAREHPGNAEAQNDVARAWHNIGSGCHDRGELARALRAYEQALTIRRQLVKDQPQEVEYQYGLSLVCNNLGKLHRQIGRRAEALRYQQEAQEILERLIQGRPGSHKYQRGLANACSQAGVLHHEAGRNDEARRCHQQALAIRERLARSNPAVMEIQHELGMTLHDLILVHRDTGRLPEALQSCQDCATVYERLCAAHPTDPQFRNALAVAYRYNGELHRRLDAPAEGLRWLEQARSLLEQLVNDHPENLQHQRALGGVYESLGFAQEKGQAREALAFFEKARAIREKMVRANPGNLEDHSNLGAVLNNAGIMLAQLGRLEEAETVYQQAIDHQRPSFEKAPNVMQYRRFLSNHYIGLGSVYRDRNQPAKAFACAKQRQQLWPHDSAELLRVAAELALCIPLIGKGNTELTPEEQTDRQRYADEAMAALRQTVDSGLRDAAKLRKWREFIPLRSRADFQELVKELEEK